MLNSNIGDFQIGSLDDKVQETPQEPLQEEIEEPSQETEEAVTHGAYIDQIEFDWVTISAGPFIMGDDDFEWGAPAHEIDLPEYQIARVPVTNLQYKQFVDATGHAAPEHWQDGTFPDGKADHPVVYVSWQDAQVYCQWAGVRLPTEAEWEKAARGTDGRVYPWGTKPPPDQKSCNFNNVTKDTTPVDARAKGISPYGVLDMAGNVWEWTSTLFMDNPYQADDGREDGEADGARVIRGGSFFNDKHYMCCANRLSSLPDMRRKAGGFRVVAASND